MWPQEEELPCGISPSSTLNLTLAAGPCGTTHWHGIMITFILRTALTGTWDTTWAYGVARDIAADTPSLALTHKKRSCTVFTCCIFKREHCWS